ncbi:alpha/beta hydrolase family protein [Verminephrobacter aporrectodeae]|uniref:alpha/beta hydrolase family protein n=1 Tax=Verminephrobacter aporrectodeae TaxID=1110389 RepID=UPI0022447083|nr:hypothetical protein [Verminephrobacter aporrectodeae]
MCLNNDLPSLRIFRCWRAALLTALGLGLGLSAAHAAGFREITTQGVRAGVWYPGDASITPQRLVPFETKMARNAPIREGQHPVVLFSHGNGGRYRNHYLTAQVLADTGFVVIAPQHEADYLVGGRRTAQALDHRYVELARALKAVREDPAFRDHLAPEPVHGVGYSLGGMTIMLASGAGFASERAERHCRENQRADIAFCDDDPGFFHRLIQSFRHDPDLRPTPDPFRHPPLVTGRAVVVAPVFQGVDPEKPLSMAHLTVIAIDGDRIAKPEFHAHPLFDAAKQQVPARSHTVPGHHHAFIAPFPKWLTDQEDIPVAKDPEGFDRPAFLRTVNRIILNALAGD